MNHQMKVRGLGFGMISALFTLLLGTVASAQGEDVSSLDPKTGPAIQGDSSLPPKPAGDDAIRPTLVANSRVIEFERMIPT
jgi:hypothetical protein